MSSFSNKIHPVKTVVLPKNDKERAEMEKKAQDQIVKAAIQFRLANGSQLGLSIARFFACLTLNFDYKVSWSEQTAATDGESIWYNPAFILSLSTPQLLFLVAHEAMHPALFHHTRRGRRDPQLWNIAADAPINQTLLESGFTGIAGGVYFGQGVLAKFPGTNAGADEVYKWLVDNNVKPEDVGGKGNSQDGKGKSGKGEGQDQKGEGSDNADPGGCGRVVDPKSITEGSGLGERSRAEAVWKNKVESAIVASKKAGNLPSGLATMLLETHNPEPEAADALVEFLHRHVSKDDRSWRRVNRRMLSIGHYAPGRHGYSVDQVVFAVDTSGSCFSEPILRKFASRIEGVLEAYNCEAVIYYHDVAVHHVQKWRPADGPLKLEARGGGGTSHVPVMERVEKDGLDPMCLVCLTDLYTCFPAKAPRYPVLWVVCDNKNATAPFGKIVHIRKGDWDE